MPINGHGQNMLSGGTNGLLNVCVNNATSGSNSTKTNNSSKNGHRSSHQTHPHLSNVSTSSSPTSFMHESHSNGPILMSGGPMSPNSQDEYSNGYDLNSHLKRKELFTQRKQREFIPDNKKDDSYWDRRRRNNEAAKRSREKRRYNDMVLEQRVVELTKENHVLKAQLDAIKDKYNICGENLVSVEQIMATLPTTEQVLSITKRPKFSNGPGSSPSDLYPQSPGSPIPTSVIQQSSSGPASVDSSSPPAPSSAAPTNVPTIVAPIITQTPQIQPSAVAAAAAFAHLNNSYMDTSPQRNTYKYRDSGTIEIDSRHEIYGPRPNFHNADHPTPSNNTNGCNGSNTVNARYNQHLSPLSRSANAQAEHHRHAPHAIASHSHSHLHPLQHFETNDVNKISQSNTNCNGSDTEITAVDDDSNVLNLSRRRNSDTNNCNGNHKAKNGNETPPRSIIYASLGSSASTEDDQYSVDNQPISDTNNSLPLKLRHKSHLGDKDAATALLALQHIKQEPNSRLSPPWDGEGSSDERDSGISIGAAEWGIQRSYPLNDRPESSQIPLNIRSMTAKTFTIPTSVGINGIGAAIGNLAANLSSVGVMGGLTMNSCVGSVLGVNENSSDRDERNHRYGEQKSFRAPVMCHLEINSTNTNDEGNVKEENVHLKTQIARLESEVASIKNMMILNTNSASATAVQ